MAGDELRHAGDARDAREGRALDLVVRLLLARVRCGVRTLDGLSLRRADDLLLDNGARDHGLLRDLRWDRLGRERRRSFARRGHLAWLDRPPGPSRSGRTPARRRPQERPALVAHGGGDGVERLADGARLA